MMVKDGLQLKYGSLLDAISPFIMNGFLSQIDEAIYLTQEESQNAVALVILQSILIFLGLWRIILLKY